MLLLPGFAVSSVERFLNTGASQREKIRETQEKLKSTEFLLMHLWQGYYEHSKEKVIPGDILTTSNKNYKKESPCCSLFRLVPSLIADNSHHGEAFSKDYAKK